MIYITISAEDGTVTAIEAIENPVYVCWQERNSTTVRCSEVKAQGVLSLDGSTIYQLSGKDAIPNVSLVATFITMAEYDNLLLESTESPDNSEDTEDVTPEVPDNTTEEEILTRAELTSKVALLEEQLAATKILLGVE